jgi:ubiquinone/menaquinone biosynthesis C-methylase UbiE
MQESTEGESALSAEALRHYEVEYDESRRLEHGPGQLELARSQELILRYLPPAPATVLDVGGGPGRYALWLAQLGYAVHLIDAVALHIEQAREAAAKQPALLASASVGDARKLDFADASADAVLLLGPLYHLVERTERLRALAEARRVLRPGGVVLAAGISRFASLFDGLWRNLLDDSEFQAIVGSDLVDGQHRNPTGHPSYFTTAYFHHPEELREEFEAVGLQHRATLAIEGPAWLLPDFDAHWNDPLRRKRLLAALSSIENEPTLIGASAHLMCVGTVD